MAIELTTATTQQLSGIRQSLGASKSIHELLFPGVLLSFDGQSNIDGGTNRLSSSIVDFKHFGNFKSFSNLFQRGLTTILNAEALVNLENQGTGSALTLTNNSLSQETLNQLFTDLPATNKTVTINVAGNPGAATCDPTIATAKGYTVVTS